MKNKLFRLKKGDRNNDGFTLIELIIVVAILGILIAVAFPAVGWFQAYSKVQGLHANNQQIIKMVQAEYISNGGVESFFVGGDPSGSSLSFAQGLMQQAAETVVARISESTTGSTSGTLPSGQEFSVQTLSGDGTNIIVCVYTFTEDYSAARTDCSLPAPFSVGPDYGYEQFD